MSNSLQCSPPWNVALQVLLSMGFLRQEYLSGLPFPPPGDLPDPGIKPVSPTSTALAGGFFTTEPLGKPSWKVQRDTYVLNHATLIEEDQARAICCAHCVPDSSLLPTSPLHNQSLRDTWRWVAGIGNLRKVKRNVCLIEMRPKRLKMKSSSLSLNLKAFLNRSYSYFYFF